MYQYFVSISMAIPPAKLWSYWSCTALDLSFLLNQKRLEIRPIECPSSVQVLYVESFIDTVGHYYMYCSGRGCKPLEAYEWGTFHTAQDGCRTLNKKFLSGISTCQETWDLQRFAVSLNLYYFLVIWLCSPLLFPLGVLELLMKCIAVSF